MENKAYLTAMDVSELLGVSRSKAYQIIKSLNVELAEKGYIVLSGKVPTKYLQEKYYGLASA